MVQELKTKVEFDDVLEKAGNKLVAIYFTACWCGASKSIGPKFVAFSESDEYTDVEFYEVDTDANNETARDLAAFPTFKFYKNGQLVTQVLGACEEKIKEALAEHK